jgi:hypothetical protein
MPTASRLVAALDFGALGYVIYITMLEIYADETVPVYLLPLCCVAGLWAGWVICGKHALYITSGIGAGYSAIVCQAFLILFIMSFVIMIERSLRRRYDGPMEAIVDTFTLMFENGLSFGTPEMGIILLVGGFVSGAAAGIAGRRFPH